MRNARSPHVLPSLRLLGLLGAIWSGLSACDAPPAATPPPPDAGEAGVRHLHGDLDRTDPRLHVDRGAVGLVVRPRDLDLAEALHDFDRSGGGADQPPVDLDEELGRLESEAAGGDGPLALVVLDDLGDREIARRRLDLERDAHERVGRR